MVQLSSREDSTAAVNQLSLVLVLQQLLLPPQSLLHLLLLAWIISISAIAWTCLVLFVPRSHLLSCARVVTTRRNQLVVMSSLVTQTLAVATFIRWVWIAFPWLWITLILMCKFHISFLPNHLLLFNLFSDYKLCKRFYKWNTKQGWRWFYY